MPLETFQVVCPYCFESVDIDVESDVEGSFVQDCEVCCQPWQINLMGGGGRRQLDVQRAQ